MFCPNAPNPGTDKCHELSKRQQQLQTNFTHLLQITFPPLCIFISRPTSRAVKQRPPSRLEAEGEQQTAATLPPASEVKAIADCTVVANAQIKNRYTAPDRHSPAPTRRTARPNREEDKVLHITHRWSPVAAACNNGFPGEFGAMHKEQQARLPWSVLQ